MPLEPVSTSTKGEAAYHALRNAIRDGSLAPGERLTLTALSRDLGMSLTPVREALRRLSAQGLVEHQPNRGTVVAEYTRERAQEIYRLRLALEPLAVELAAQNATAADKERISTALRACEAAVAEGRTVDFPQLNAEFHKTLYDAAHSQYLTEFIDRLWSGVPFQAVSLADRDRPSNAQHQAIAEAVYEGEAVKASGLLRAHIEEAVDSLGLLSADPGKA
ncbi:GntR family transcriptional regulator [Streptomyces sp. NPDC096354]|uniref:GntR family transcriptional regulator n=1 Tax=Streptomyces sp. NPDC096354 TaxID=3366088 RepID=UPI003817F41A